MIKVRRLPTIGGMTTAAVRAQLTIVCIVLFMAGITIFWRALKDSIDVAFLASHSQMFSYQRESRFGMININLIPAIRCVAGSTISPKLAGMFIIFLMTRETIRWRTI